MSANAIVPNSPTPRQAGALSRREFLAAALALPATQLPTLVSEDTPAENREAALQQRIEQYSYLIQADAFELYALDSLDHEYDRIMVGVNLIRGEDITGEDWAWRIDYLMSQMSLAAMQHEAATGDRTLHEIITSLSEVVSNLTDLYKTYQPYKEVAEAARQQRRAIR